MQRKTVIKYAFWEYDHYPFVLSGKVVGKKDSEGRVMVEGYGGMRFQPLRILNGDVGRVTSNKLNTLRGEYLEAQKWTRNHYCKEALIAAPFLKNCKRTSAYKATKPTRRKR